MAHTIYRAYFQLHDSPWEVAGPIIAWSPSRDIQIRVSRGPLYLPAMAAPKSRTVAGGARIEVADDLAVGDEQTWAAVAVTVGQMPPTNMTDWATWSDALFMRARGFMAVVGVVLRQRRPAIRLGEFFEVHPDEGEVQTHFRWIAYGAHKITLDEQVAEEVRQTLATAVRQEGLPPRLASALEWLEQSKSADNGADRLQAAWTALDSLLGRGGSYADLVDKTAKELADPWYGLGLNVEQIKAALGLCEMQTLRNKITHRRYRPSPWPSRDDLIGATCHKY